MQMYSKIKEFLSAYWPSDRKKLRRLFTYNYGKKIELHKEDIGPLVLVVLLVIVLAVLILLIW